MDIMDIYMPIATTDRHSDIVSTFMGDILPLKRKKQVHALQEQCPLVYFGTKDLPTGFELVDAKNISDVERFIDNIIELEYVQPDFILFKDNPYLKNKKGTRTAGQPDLIVEVWSETNTANIRAFLKQLYATSPITEHWYIEQDSNEIQCYVGKERISNQNLNNVLVTQKGLEFDLRYLAI